MFTFKSTPIQKHTLGRRAFLLSIAAVASGCAQTEIPAVRDLRAIWQILSGTHPESPIARADIDKLSYATMRAKIGRGPRGLLALGRYEGQNLHWYSRDGALFVTRNGRVLQTAGLPENLKGTQWEKEDPVGTGLQKLTGPTEFIRWIDTDYENRYQMKIISKFELIRREQITILDRSYNTIYGREINRAPDIGWKFTNLYWIDENSGFVWKSRQHIARSFGALELEVLKPPRKPPSVT